MSEKKPERSTGSQPVGDKTRSAMAEQEATASWDKSAVQTAPSTNTKVGPKQLVILLVLSLMLAIIVIDSTIVNITLPSIAKDFSISVKNLEWITSLYALVFGSFLLTWGKLGDEFGRKKNIRSRNNPLHSRIH